MATDPRAALIAEIEAETTHTAVWTGRGRLSPGVLAALRRVRREAFVPDAKRPIAYLDLDINVAADGKAKRHLIKPAVLASQSGRVGVLATHATLQGDKFRQLVAQFAGDTLTNTGNATLRIIATAPPRT